MRALFASAVILIALGTAGTVWATSALGEGIRELPRHWWSSFPVGLVAVGAALALVAWLALRHVNPSAKAS